MWILLSEVIIFIIILSLIIGYFGGFGLGINKEVKFDSQVKEIVINLDKKIKSHKNKENMENKSNTSNTNTSTNNENDNDIYSNLTYKIERDTFFRNYQTYKEYKIKLTTTTGAKLTYKELEKIAKDIISNTSNNTGNNENNENNKQITSCYTGTNHLPYLEPNTNWSFDKYKDVQGNGGINTIAHYHNVGKWQGKNIDLLVKVINLSNLKTLRLQDSTPKGFKKSILTDSDGKKVPNVGFFLRNKINDPKGTKYSATLKFIFVDSKTLKPVKLNTEIQVYDLDNFYARTEKVTTDLNQFYKFQLSPNTHLTYDIVGNKISVYNNHDEDLRYFSPITAVKFILRNQDSITLSFDYIKNKPAGKDGGRAGFNVVINPTTIGIPVCYLPANNKQTKEDTQNPPTYNPPEYVKVTNPNIEFTYKLDGKWGNDYCYKFNIKNNSDEELTHWRIKFNANTINIKDNRNGNIVCNNGTCITTGESWNNPLLPGKEVEIGFCTQNNNNNDEPTNVELQQLKIETKDEILFNPPTTCEKILSFNGSNQFAETQLSNQIIGLDLWNLKSANGEDYFCYDKNSNSLYYIQDLSNIQKKSNNFVIGYPEIYTGNKPWNTTPNKEGLLPIKLSDISNLINHINYEVKSPSNLSMNVATDGWFTPTKYENNPNGSSQWIEFMIMWYRNLHNIYGDYKGEITLPININGKTQNITFKIYVSNNGWKFIKLIPTNNFNIFKSANIKFDIKEIVEKVNPYINGDLINDYYLSSWHFGTEWGDPYTKSAYLARKIKDFSIYTNKTDSQNNTSSQNSNIGKGILFYYGWPSVINKSKTLEEAENNFSKYKIVVLGWGLQNYTHPDYKNTYKIISDLKNKVEFYGYVPLYNNGTMTFPKLVSNILKWKSLGAKGIFLDEVGYDYMGKLIPEDIYKGYLNYVYKYIKSLGLNIMLNGYTTGFLKDLKFDKNDIVVIEDCYYYNNEQKQEYVDHTNEFINTIKNLSTKPQTLCLATGKSNDENSVNNIYNDLLNKNLDVNYISVQDDYGADSIVDWKGK